MRVVLASASPARLSVLRGAGLDPKVEVSAVNESAVLAGLSEATPAATVTALAEAKAHDVARRLRSAGLTDDTVVIGCDSMLLLNGELVGKPTDATDARRRWAAMSGRKGVLLTGHAVLRLGVDGSDRSATGHAETIVRFSEPDDAELDAYVATGEPLAVAGAFTLDGLGGWFVEGVEGDPSNVIGISLPLTRRLLATVGVAVPRLWRKPAQNSAAS